MNAKTYLEQLEIINHKIENKLAEREQWNAIATNTTSVSNDVRVQTSVSKQKMEQAVIKIIEIENEIDRLTDELIDRRVEIIETVEKLNSTSYDFIHKRYIQGIDPKKLSKMYGLSLSRIYSLQAEALGELQRILDTRTMR